MTKKIIILLIGGFLLSSSLIGALYLVKKQQETRKQAATEWCGHCPQDEDGNYIDCCPGEEMDSDCAYFNGEGCYKIIEDDGGEDTPDCGETQCESGGVCYDDGWCCATNQDTGKEYHCCSGSWVEKGTPCDTATCDPSTHCTFDCDGRNASVDCADFCSVNVRQLDICRGQKTGGNCQGCEDCSGGTNCDLPCHCCEGKPLTDPCWSTCYEKGIGYDPQEGDYAHAPYWDGTYDCRNTQQDVLIDGEYAWNCTWEEGRAWEECAPTASPTPADIPSPTDTPTPTDTPPPTSPPEYECDCLTLKMYDQDWNLISDYSQLRPGDQVNLLATGETNHPQGITKARFKVNNQPWQESEQRHQGNFYWVFEIPEYGDYSIKAEVYNPSLGWY